MKQVGALLFLAPTLMLVFAVGCSTRLKPPAVPVATTAAVPVSEPQKISLNLGDEPPQLDSALATDVVSSRVLGQVAEGLVRYGEGGRIEKGSGEAADWSISEDGLTYTFKLKEGLRWSDGQPLTVKDYVFAWFRALDPLTASPYAAQMHYIKGAQAWSQLDPKGSDFEQRYQELKGRVAIRALDQRTLQVQLEHPTPYFLALTGFPTYYPQRQDLVAKHGPRYAKESNLMVYNGPFMIQSWNHDNELVLVKNPAYWDADRVRLAQISFKMVKDAATAINMFEANQLDSVGLPGGYAAQYEGRPGFHREASAQTFYIAVNLYNPAKQYLQNVHIRKALSLALDRQEFVKALLRDDGVSATGLVPSSIAGFNGQAYRAAVGDLLGTKADPTGASKELAQGLQDLRMTELPSLELLVNQSDIGKKYAQGLQAMVQQNLPGVRITLVPVEFKALLARSATGDFDLVLTGWLADYNDPMTFMDLFVSGASYNDPHWTNKQYDHYIQDAAINSDQVTRLKDFAAAEKILLGELPVIPLYTPGVSGIRKPWLKGILNFSVGPPFDLKWTYVEGRAS